MFTKRFIIIIYVFLCSFSFSHASIEIRELMYNPEGSDTNREWVEVYNNGSTVDISTWYFYENDTYHGLHPENFTNLANGERALIVKDITMAQSELGSGIKYIKSSFTLNNTGEELVIADSDRSHVDNYTYNSELGGNGDGKSLQLVNSSWISANPTPGNVNSSSAGNSNDGQSDNKEYHSDINNFDIEVVYSDPYYEAKLEVSDVIVAQSDFNVKAEIYYIKNGKKTRKLGGYYFINFGNGDVLESDERIDSAYRYRKAGNYMMVFEYYHSKFAFKHGEDPDTLLKKKISVIAHDLEIIKVDSFDGVVLKNNTKVMVDLYNWKIIWEGKSYTFPRYSYVSAGNQINILFHTLNFSPRPKTWSTIQLLSDAYKPISVFPKVIKKKKVIKYISSQKKIQDKEDILDESKTLDFDSLKDANVDFFGNSTDSYLDQYLSDNPNKLRVNFGEENKSGVAGNSSSDKNEKHSIYYALGSLVLMLGVGRFAKHKNNKENKEEIENFGSIEIIE